jgi:hypothetical protein
LLRLEKRAVAFETKSIIEPDICREHGLLRSEDIDDGIHEHKRPWPVVVETPAWFYGRKIEAVDE